MVPISMPPGGSGPGAPSNAGPFVARFSPHPKSKNALRSDAPVREAEKDAQVRISRAESSAEQAERQSAQSIDEIRDEFQRQSEIQAARNASAVEVERDKGYEQVLETRRNLQNELNRIKRDGDRDVQGLTNYYQDQLRNTDERGNNELRDKQTRTNLSVNYETKKADQEFQSARDEHARRLTSLREDQDDALATISGNSRKEFERYRDNTAKATEEAHVNFDQRYEGLRQQHDETLGALQKRSSDELKQLKWDTSRKLDAYESRAHDPFYQLVVPDAELHETSDAYVLTASVPFHEQNHISVNVRGNELVFTGNRRNEEKVDDETGGKTATSSFQTFSRTFPMEWPVDSRAISKRFEGETLVVEIPKKLGYRPAPMHKIHVEPIRSQRPDFPENLPLAKNEKMPVEPDDGAPKKKNWGARTLS